MSEATDHKEWLQLAAEAAAARLPDNHGLILLVVPMNTPDPVLHYAANVPREDAIKVVKEWLFRLGEGEEWMKHLG